MELSLTTDKKIPIYERTREKQIQYTDLFHVKKDPDAFFIANVDTLDTQVNFKYTAFILLPSFVEVALPFL